MISTIPYILLFTHLIHQLADGVSHAEQLRGLVEHVGGELSGELHLAHQVSPPDERPQFLYVLNLLLRATLFTVIQ